MTLLDFMAMATITLVVMFCSVPMFIGVITVVGFLIRKAKKLLGGRE